MKFYIGALLVIMVAKNFMRFWARDGRAKRNADDVVSITGRSTDTKD